MAIEINYKCDGCGKDVTTDRYVTVETQYLDRRPDPPRGIRRSLYGDNMSLLLCEPCVANVIKVLRDTGGSR